MEKYTVSLKQLVMQHDLCPLHRAKDYDTARIVTADVNRPALQLAGFYEYFDPNRLQFIGRVESKYLEMLSPERRYSALESLMRFDISEIGRASCRERV